MLGIGQWPFVAIKKAAEMIYSGLYSGLKYKH